MSDAAIPLLETKLHAPRRRRGIVARPRLRERLDRRELPALTLVSAAAGFGKTTLVADWFAEGPATAWLSLDRRDNDPAQFWSYVVAALRSIQPEAGEKAHALLQTPQPSMDAVVATLLNDLHTVSHELVLVLDDYHVIESAEIQQGMAFLLEHLPPQIHLVLASRADPPLPLAGLRARGDLLEIRAADLRFTPDEAAAYLNDAMDLALAPADVEVLEARTEGWIAALQLAALSMQGRDDIAGFIADFAGDDRFILDYLVGEVLERQTEDARTFLLETSILSRFTGSLCDAVTGRGGGRATLERLERANLFLVPLDDRRTWYRYHHLFADVLQARLSDERPDHMPALHRRASDWHERHGDRPEAIRHALAGHDFERAAKLVELAAPAMLRARREATLREWFEALPEELFPSRPVLSIGYAGALMASGDFEGIDRLLHEIDRRLDPAAADEVVVVDHEGFATLPAQVAIYRAALALIAGDTAGTITHANRALELMAPDDLLRRGSAAALVGLAHWALGDLDAAERRYAEAARTLEQAGHIADVLGCSLALGDIRTSQGRLRAATHTFEVALDLAETHGVRRGTADMHVGLAEVLLERNDLDGAANHLATSSTLGEHAALGQHAYRSRVALARLRQAQGDPDSAYELLDEAERVFNTDFSPAVRPVPAVIARARLAGGDVAAAVAWARDRGIDAGDDLSYVHEFEHLTLARVLLARHADDQAAALLERILAAADEGHREGSAIEALVLQALVNRHRRDTAAAAATLDQALLRAEPEKYARIFLDEGPPMIELLAAAEHGPAGKPARRLLAHRSNQARPARTGLVDELSARELDVLRLLRSDLSGPAIARELLVSLNTFRTHTKNIYAKLGVNNRREAVRRAADLGL